MGWLPEHRRTMAVGVFRGGRIECIWYGPFVEARTTEELIGCIEHEIEHLVRVHCTRLGSRIAFIWNLASDMAVNGRADLPRIGYRDASIVLPLGPDSKETMIWIPKDWPDDETADYFYEKIMVDKDWEWARRAAANGDECPAGMIDDHGYWGNTDLSPEEVRQCVQNVVSQATSRVAGKVPGHLVSVLERLGKPIVSWNQVLRQYFGRHLGNRRKTYSRRDRRNDTFGSPGISHHAAAKASIIIDTSGSISDNDLSQFFAEIETICYKARVCLLQWDHAFQSFTPRYRRGDWKKIKIKGRGGTDMSAPVEYLYERGMIGDLCIMLTDGYCSYTTPKPFPMITCITTRDGDRPNWGRVLDMNPHKEAVEAA